MRDVRTAIQTRPSEAFGKFNHESARVLSSAQRLILAREAVERLAVQVEAGGNAPRNLADVRSARRDAVTLEPEVRQGLDALGRVAERRLLADGLAKVRAGGERGRPAELARTTREWLGHLRDNPAEAAWESAEFRAARAEARTALQELGTAAERLDVLERFQGGAREADGPRPAESARVLRTVERDALPPALRARYDGLRGLAEVRSLAQSRWQQTPSATGVRESVARLESGLRDLPGADRALGKMLLQEVACRALLEGHPELAKTLLPAGGPAEHAGNLLRDLKALALGEGKVETSPARAVLSDPGLGPVSPRGPPAGLEPLIPEGARAGWRPPVKESALAYLPPLERAEQLGQTLKGKVETEAKPVRAALDAQATAARTKLEAVHDRVTAAERGERRRFAEVEAVLDRRLKPAERVKARMLLAQNQQPAQVANAIQSAPGQPDEDEEFATDCARRLGKSALTVAERARAIRLKKQGRTAAEVAALLRP
jgi:hypothetical protein